MHPTLVLALALIGAFVVVAATKLVYVHWLARRYGDGDPWAPAEWEWPVMVTAGVGVYAGLWWWFGRG